MEASGKGFSFAGTKNIPADMTDTIFCRIRWGIPPKLALPTQRGSVSTKNSILGSFWKLIKFKCTLYDLEALNGGSINSKPYPLILLEVRPLTIPHLCDALCVDDFESEYP